MLQGVTPHLHEQQALEWVKKELPDSEPFRVWCLFELIDLHGRRYEVDLLVLGYDALYHVEIKGWSGRISGSRDHVDWLIEPPQGPTFVRQNPYGPANHKSKVLADLLQRRLGSRRPHVETLVFLSSEDARVELQGAARYGVVTRKDFVRAVQFAEFPGADPHRRRARIDRPLAGEIAEVLKSLGIRKSEGARRVGPYQLGELLEEGPGYQDHLGQHERLKELQRRARSYLVAQSATAERRDQLRRAAEREARNLTSIGDHPGILRLHDFEADGPLGGPCLLFERFERGEPLDAYLRRNPKLPLDARISILEQVADALAYCHRKHVMHRGLCPQAVLVRERADRKLETKLYNFQLSAHDDSQGTVHVSLLGPEPALVYRAPELVEDPSRTSAETDMFSLGALAFFLFTGRPPGGSLAERQRLLDGAGGALSVAAFDDAFAAGALSASADDDGSTRELDELVRMATDPVPVNRPDSPIEWVQMLVDAITAPAPPTSSAPKVDPLEARQGQQLGAFEVLKVLGTGATSRVLRVLREQSTYALKVSLGEPLDDRLRAEAQTLRALRGDRIVALIDKEPFVLEGRLCLLLQDAGETLAELLSREGPQSLDYARRWGEDLLFALRELEEKARFHRDIKPANVGIATSAAKRTRNLFLFDFSLAAVPLTELEVGTPVYRDPFLLKRGTYDHAADRYSAAITLYELLLGTRPVWGNGEVAATASGADMVIDAERFDPSVRARLHAFFKRAFARDASARHESADAMRAEWLDAFRAPEVPAPTESAPAPLAAPPIASLPLTTPVQAVASLSARAKNALDRAGVITLAHALSLPTNQLSAIRGVGRETAREIAAFARDLRGSAGEHTVEVALQPSYRGEAIPLGQVPRLPAAVVLPLVNAGIASTVDLANTSRERLARILRAIPRGLEQVEAALSAAAPGPAVEAADSLDAWVVRAFPTGKKRWQYVRELFGIDEAPGGRFVGVSTELARRHKVAQPTLSVALATAKEDWREHHTLEPLAERLLPVLDASGGVAPLARLASALLQHLSAEPSDEARRKASALARAFAEASPELVLGRVRDATWAARSADRFAVVKALGELADELARREPLAAFEEVGEELARRTAETALSGAPPEVLANLAAEASATAALSARLEIYPRGMDARRALHLSTGALAASRIPAEDVRRVVALRYPAADKLPEDDELAHLLEPLGFTREEHLFVRRGAPSATASSTAHFHTPPRTSHAPRGPVLDPAAQGLIELKSKLRSAAKSRSYRVLEIAAAVADQATPFLQSLLGARTVSLDAAILDELFVVLREEGVDDTSVVIDTDRRGPEGGDDWVMLSSLVERAALRVVRRVTAEPGTLLLTEPGVLGRYQLSEPLLELLRASQQDSFPGVFLLVPSFSEAHTVPVIDALERPLPIPLSSPAQHVRIPDAWSTQRL
ncbi:MAG: protein kinase [Polyangiaceae bacterium]|nr:protein kinase [Polyangiaceae bacterium]